jgi:alkanesulfonate monooxygenase SsuD/methylene tetrahydromethanopterin reductase-like flavin-dependent oxidoreductase (luciferase family)
MAGAFGPCALAVTAGLADGWIPSPGSMPTGEIPAVRRRIDAAAEAVGRWPGEIRGILNVSIRIDPAAEPQPRGHRSGQARGKPAMGPNAKGFRRLTGCG